MLCSPAADLSAGALALSLIIAEATGSPLKQQLFAICLGGKSPLA
jgi:hypothetical protein